MKKEEFKKGVRFYVNGNYRQFYKVYCYQNETMFIKKYGAYQCDVIAIMEDGIHVLTKVLDHDTDTFIPFSAMELIPEENRY